MSERAAWWIPAGLERLEGVGFEFGRGPSVAVGALLLLAVFIASALFAASGLKRSPAAVRSVLALLRAAALTIALFLVLDPALVGHRVRPGEQTVAVLFDDSRSMRIAAGSGRTRGEILRAAFEQNERAAEAALRQRFQVAFYGVGEGVYRVSGPEGLAYNARESRLAEGVLQVAREISPDRLAGVLLLSDGLERGGRAPDDPDWAAGLGAPLLTVAVPAEPWRDLEVGEFATPRVQFADVPIVLDVPVHAQGLRGREANVRLIEISPRGEGAEPLVLDSRPIRFDSDDERQTTRFEFRPEREGWISYAVDAQLAAGPISAQPGPVPGAATADDLVPQNNRREFILDLRPKDYRVFYFSGRPNWENAFIRRALAGEKELNLTTHIRISKAEKEFVFRGKRSSMTNRLFEGFEREGAEQPRYDESVFLRFGRQVEPGSDGYPTRPADLYGYDLVIWGDVEYEFFTPEQVEQTRDFVRKRGGTLLLLGGPRAFSEGDFAGTLIDGMLPVMLRRSPAGPEATPAAPPEDWKLQPTLEGEIAGLLSLDPDADTSHRLWGEMPALTGLNAFATTRPGATVLAEAVREGRSEPLFVQHRYGEGRCAALATGTTWLWKMERGPQDASHARIWRQVIRDLAKDAPRPILLNSRRDPYEAGREERLEFLVRDEIFEPREGLRVEVVLTSPSGGVIHAAVDESIQQPGIYTALWQPDAAGPWGVRLTAIDGEGKPVGSLEDRLQVSADIREFHHARPDEAYLERIAEASGGERIPLTEVADAVGRIPWRIPQSHQPVRVHLWHHPAFYLALVALLATEWLLRRRRGYA